MGKNVFRGAFFLKFWPYVWLVFKSGFKSRAGYDGTRSMLQCVTKYFNFTSYYGMLVSPISRSMTGFYITIEFS